MPELILDLPDEVHATLLLFAQLTRQTPSALVTELVQMHNLLDWLLDVPIATLETLPPDLVALALQGPSARKIP